MSKRLLITYRQFFGYVYFRFHTYASNKTNVLHEESWLFRDNFYENIRNKTMLSGLEISALYIEIDQTHGISNLHQCVWHHIRNIKEVLVTKSVQSYFVDKVDRLCFWVALNGDNTLVVAVAFSYDIKEHLPGVNVHWQLNFNYGILCFMILE